MAAKNPDPDFVFAAPAKGLKVRKEDGPHVAPEGERLRLTPYVRRRLRKGDLVPATAPSKAVKDARK